MKIMEYEKWLQEITFVAWTTTIIILLDSDADTDAGALMWVDGRRNNDDDELSQLRLLLLDVEIIKTH